MPRSCLFRKRDQRTLSLSVKFLRNSRAFSLRFELYLNISRSSQNPPCPPFFKGGYVSAYAPQGRGDWSVTGLNAFVLEPQGALPRTLRIQVWISTTSLSCSSWSRPTFRGIVSW